jgi:hypothetical protein
MRIHLTLLLGMLLSNCVLTVAQIPAVQIASTREPIAPITTMAQMVSAPLLARAPLLVAKPAKYPDHCNYTFAGVYERDQGLDGLEMLSQIREVKTLFIAMSSLPLLNLWGGRLRFDGFTSTIDTQNVQLGPSAGGGLEDFRPPRQTSSVESRSIDRYGLSLSFHFGRGARIGRPAQGWHSLARVLDAAR